VTGHTVKKENARRERGNLFFSCIKSAGTSVLMYLKMRIKMIIFALGIEKKTAGVFAKCLTKIL